MSPDAGRVQERRLLLGRRRGQLHVHLQARIHRWAFTQFFLWLTLYLFRRTLQRGGRSRVAMQQQYLLKRRNVRDGGQLLPNGLRLRPWIYRQPMRDEHQRLRVESMP